MLKGQKGRGRGFASLEKKRRREIASQGGHVAHERGTAHEWDSEAARAARLKGVRVESTMNTPNFDELIEAAKRLRYDDDPERIKDRLWQIIVRNQNYLDRRVRKGRTGAFNQTVVEDSVAIAAAIKLIGEKR